MNYIFYLNAILFGIGLAMDAFSVSLANGLNDPEIKFPKANVIALTFSLFQTAMPLIGWICIHTIASAFEIFHRFIPWIALILLLYIGGKMILDSRKDEEEGIKEILTFKDIFFQGIATSIDALSVGFTIAHYVFYEALLEAIIIGVVTYVLCIIGVYIGKKFGSYISKYASFIGGCILIFIGIEIFVSGIFN